MLQLVIILVLDLSTCKFQGIVSLIVKMRGHLFDRLIILFSFLIVILPPTEICIKSQDPMPNTSILC